MCVAVTMLPGTELADKEVLQMGNANGDGFGIAWAEEGIVHWWKTVVYDVDYLTWLINSKKDYPRLVHFRLSTVGGVNVNLCHPFEVGPLAACQPKGHANKVMIHNGHWHRANDLFDILKKEQALPDNGPWSDTRLAAHLAAWDEDWLSTVTGKVATLDGEGNMKLFTTWGTWDKLREGIMVSNKHWESHTFNYKKTGASKWYGWEKEWDDKTWQEKEAHDAAKAKEKEKEKERESKESSKKQGEKEGKSEGVGTSRRATPDSSVEGSGARGHTHGNDQKGKGEKDENSTGTARAQVTVSQTGERVYDYTPWKNQETGEWWQVDPTRTKGERYALRRLTEPQALAILEQVTAAGGEAG